jgi:hypothetical protein
VWIDGDYYPGAIFVAGVYEDYELEDDGFHVPGGVILGIERLPSDYAGPRLRRYRGHRRSRRAEGSEARPDRPEDGGASTERRRSPRTRRATPIPARPGPRRSPGPRAEPTRRAPPRGSAPPDAPRTPPRSGPGSSRREPPAATRPPQRRSPGSVSPPPERKRTPPRSGTPPREPK